SRGAGASGDSPTRRARRRCSSSCPTAACSGAPTRCPSCSGASAGSAGSPRSSRSPAPARSPDACTRGSRRIACGSPARRRADDARLPAGPDGHPPAPPALLSADRRRRPRAHPGHRPRSPARTGAARVLRGAETAAGGRCGSTLLPLGMVFHDPGTFRSASVQIMVGEPVPTADVIAAYPEHPADVVRELTARIAEAIRAGIVEAEDHYTLELLDVLERAWFQEATRPGAAEQALSWKQRVMRGARYLAEREPHRVAALRRRVELYCAHLDEVGVPSEQLGRPYTLGLVVRYVVENLVWLALGLPLALWGLACHALPYWLTGKTVALLGRTAEEEATDKMAAGRGLYPRCWTLEAWLVWRLAGLALFLTFLLAGIPSGVLALASRERPGCVGRHA